MRQLFLFLMWLFVLAFGSCKKASKENALQKPDYLIFGHFYGFCMGEKCIEIFKIEQNQLYEDTNDKYPLISDSFYKGNFILLSQQKFEDTKSILNYFPSALLQETKTIIGEPDAGDWGGLYVEYKFNGVRKFWLIDKMKSNVPAAYHNFIDKLNEKISLLQ